MSQFDDLKASIFYNICKYSQRTGEITGFEIDQVDEFLPSECLSGQTRAAIRSLVGNGYLEDTVGLFSITETGIRDIEFELGREGSVAVDLQRREVLEHGIPLPALSEVAVPAAGRVASLDHNSDPYRDAVATLDAALKEFKEDRLLENEWGPEKGALVTTIEAGRNLLEQGEVQAATIFATIVAPLRVVRDRYEHAIVAGLVTAGAVQVVGALGHAITLVLRLIGMA